MACCNSIKLPVEWKAIPEIPVTETNKEQVKDLTGTIAELKNAYATLPSPYKGRCAVRVAVIAAMVVGIAVGIMALQGTLTSFPSNFMQFIRSVNWTYVIIAECAFLTLAVGATLLIMKAMRQKDKLTGTVPGKLTGNTHWVSAAYGREDTNGLSIGYLDTSTLDENGNGMAFMYIHKDEQNHTSVSLAITLFTPLHMIGAIAYNALRLVVVPFYILGRMLYEKAKGGEIAPAERFSLSDIPKEMGKSLWRIVKAPFYALTIMFAALYSFIDPLNGRKLGAYLEREWNEEVTRAEGFWSVGGPQSLWKFEGGGGPNGLGKNGFYLAGCWQPLAVAYYENGKIVRGASLTRAVDPSQGRVYTIITHEKLLAKNNELVAELETLA